MAKRGERVNRRHAGRDLAAAARAVRADLLQLLLPAGLRPHQHLYRRSVRWKDRAGRYPVDLSLSELAIGFCVGLGAGCAVITGQFFGQRDDERLSRSVHTAMTLALVVGALISVLGVVFLPAVLHPHGHPARAHVGGLRVFSLLFRRHGVLARAQHGDGAAPCRRRHAGARPHHRIGCVFNVVFDLIFVAGFKMEALGCGIATALTITINASMVMVRLMRAQGAWRLDPRRLGHRSLHLPKHARDGPAAGGPVVVVLDLQHHRAVDGEFLRCGCGDRVGLAARLDGSSGWSPRRSASP